LRQLNGAKKKFQEVKEAYETLLTQYDCLRSYTPKKNAVPVSETTEDAIVVLLNQVLEKYGEEWKKSFSYTFIYQQLEAMTTNPRGMRWNPDVINFFQTISYYGGKKVYNILRGKAFEGQGKCGKLEMGPFLFNLHMPSLSAFQHRMPKVDPYGSRHFVPSRCKAIWKMFCRIPIWENKKCKGGLIFDEIEIRHGFSYLKNSGILIGLAHGPLLVENLLTSDVDYKDQFAQKICQCFFVSNCGKICIPIHYFPTVSLSAADLFAITEDLKQRLLVEKVHVVWTSTDGFKGSLDYISKKGSIQHSRHFFDYVHMVKLGRNQLLNRQLRFLRNDMYYYFSMKDLLLWWQSSSYLKQFLCLDDIHPSDKQDILPVKNLLAAIPYLKQWALDLPSDDERKHQCEGLCMYLQNFSDLYKLFSDNELTLLEKNELSKQLKEYFQKWRFENAAGKTFISDDLYKQILSTLESFDFFFLPKPEPGDEENIVFTSILGTNIVENFFSIIRAKILYPNFWEYACVAQHAYLELVKKFMVDRPHSLQNRSLSRKLSMKYNDQSGIQFDKEDFMTICSIEFRHECQLVRMNPSEEQKIYAANLAQEYKCTRKRLTTRQKTCKQEEGELISEIDKRDQCVGIFPCGFPNCPKSYTYSGAYRNHLLKMHQLQISGELPLDMTPYVLGTTSNVVLPTAQDQCIECPSTPPLQLSEEAFFGATLNSLNLPAAAGIELVEDDEATIIEDEKENENDILAREDKEENEVVAIVFWDLETSGKTAGSNVEYMLEIGCIGWKCEAQTATETFISLVNPFRVAGECTITSKASAVSGLYSKDVSQAKRWNEVYLLWIQYLSKLRDNRGKILMLAHNSQSADENCLKCDCERYQIALPTYLIFGDTHHLYKCLHTPTKKWSIDYLCEAFNISREVSARTNTSARRALHGALEDARTLYNLSIAMVQKSIFYAATISVYDQIVKHFI
jgi:DNA polymerase III epsilon subunit-like protein